MAFEVPIQGEHNLYTATLKDETGTVILLASLASLVLTFRDKQTGQIINGRDTQNVLNTNNVTVHATSGLLTWQMQPADNVIFDASISVGDVEKHIALFKWQTTGGTVGKFQEEIAVRKEMGAATSPTTGLGSLIAGSMSTAQRNTMTPSNGMIIYNTTINRFEFRENGVWISYFLL